MSRLDQIVFNQLAEDHMKRLKTKAERTAFMTGLSLGARETNDTERTRICSNLKALYGVEVPRDQSTKTDKADKQTTKSKKMKLVDIGPDLMAKLKEFTCTI